MNRTADAKAVAAVMDAYIAGTKNRDVAGLKAIFHERGADDRLSWARTWRSARPSRSMMRLRRMRSRLITPPMSRRSG